MLFENTKSTPDAIFRGCGQSLATNALKRLMDQLEERILTDQLKNASKRLHGGDL